VRRSLVNNIGLKVLALVVALLIWKSVADDPELATFMSVPVQYMGLPEDLEISSNVMESVDVELRGPSEQLRTYGDSHPAVAIDMRDVHAGERTFSITRENLNLSRGVRLVRAIPSQLRFEFEHRISREVPVQVRFTKSPPRGYAIASYQVEPDRLMIVGPESRVKSVEQVTTDPIDLSKVVGPAEFRINAFAADPLVRFQASPQVAVKITIRKT
jgi:YbbR domain-containing protein